eukprot:Blabericola_migrator_1__1715@NODE_1461_length_4509_cov_58_942593_g963_i0_p3_GENE_NODE_1461_length_4509_cov_58_942593_g963_i0NODE_1461_length_4509_cov_58_942593_g963_i0_p3_ORF_typecomplete_len247_score21_24PIGL/PF02585_17/4_2e30_NODE_1461_length_4509_cov_58_942593_g963_i037064446
MVCPVRPGDSVLLVTAHPDDECMFFGPILNGLASHLNDSLKQLHILCATTGNAAGLGLVRSKELLQAAAIFRINPKNVHVLDEAGFRDGHVVAWDIPKLTSYIRDYVAENTINYILTFDEGGVTHHPNHVDTFRAVQRFIEYKGFRKSPSFMAAYTLRSVPLVLQYCGSLLWALLLLRAIIVALLSRHPRAPHLPPTFALVRPSHIKVQLGMRKHRSQLVWFRYLHLIFSAYTWVNIFDIVLPERH